MTWSELGLPLWLSKLRFKTIGDLWRNFSLKLFAISSLTQSNYFIKASLRVDLATQTPSMLRPFDEIFQLFSSLCFSKAIYIRLV